jgi:ketosteroid isomerase-like protein
MDPVDAVRALYQAYQDRDWSRAGSFLHVEAVVEMPGTAERLEGREAIIGFQRDYPEPWGVLSLKRQWGDRHSAAAEAQVVDAAGAVFALAAFWEVHEGRLHRGVEYWLDVGVGAPPSSRASSAATEGARAAWRRSNGSVDGDR